MSRKRKKPTAQPRALQTRPTISFRTYRAKLEALDNYAQRLGCTRNDLLEAVVDLYLADRGEDVAAVIAAKRGATDERQFNIFA